MTAANDHQKPPQRQRIPMSLRANLLSSAPDPIMAAASTPFVSGVPVWPYFRENKRRRKGKRHGNY